MTTPQPEPMPGPQEIPPAFQQNGHSPPQMALALMQQVTQVQQQMPQMLAGALASVLQQVPVQTASQFRCTQCVMTRLGWIAAHQEDTDAAHEAYVRAVTEHAELASDDPRRSIPLDFIQFLPAPLRPGSGPQGMPPIQDGTVMVNGAVFCIEHVPGAPGKPQLLVAQGGLSASMLARLAA